MPRRGWQPGASATCQRPPTLRAYASGATYSAARVRVADAGLGRQRADQRDGGFELVLGRVHALAQARAILPRERFEMLVDQRPRQRQRRRRGIERVQLHAPGNRCSDAAGDADRIEMLHAMAHRLDLARRVTREIEARLRCDRLVAIRRDSRRRRSPR